MPDSTADKTYALYANSANKKLISDLEAAGAKVFAFEPIEHEAIVFDEAANDIIANLMSFDWLIFTDVLAVDFFLAILEENATDLFELDALRFCAFGEAVADQLRFVQLHTDVIPTKIDAQTILASLKDYIGAENLKDLKFLIVKDAGNQIELGELLRHEQADVKELPVYQMNVVENKEIVKLKTLLAGGAFDEFIFTAPTDFINLRFIYSGDSFSEFFTEIKVSAMNGSILQTLNEYNFKRAVLFHTDKIGKLIK